MEFDEPMTTADEQAWAAPEILSSERPDEGLSGPVVAQLRPSLASLLAEEGVASVEQLDIALAEGQETGQQLHEVVVRQGWIDEAGLAGLVARQWGLTFVALSMIHIDERARSLLSREEAVRLGACPIAFKDGAPLIALAEPGDDRFAAVRERLGADCAFVVTTPTALALLIEECDAVTADPEVTNLAGPALVMAPLPATFSLPEDEEQSTPVVEQVDRLLKRLIDERAGSRDQLSGYREQLVALGEEQARTEENIRILEAKLDQEDRLLDSIKAKLGEFTQTLTR